LFLPLFLVFIAGADFVVETLTEWIPVVLWLIGGWLGLMLFQNKDPRTLPPLLPAVALISARAFEKNKSLHCIAPYLCCFSAPPRFVWRSATAAGRFVVDGVKDRFRGITELYRQNYFELWVHRPVKIRLNAFSRR
jgi:hypothetical protein